MACVLGSLLSNAQNKQPIKRKIKVNEEVTTASGLRYRVTELGTGKQVLAGDKVTVHYTGKLTNGTKFDSSVDRGQPATFGLNQVIPGWTEGLQLMKEGGKNKLIIPYQLGYGENGMPPTIPARSWLVFDVELVDYKAGVAQ